MVRCACALLLLGTGLFLPAARAAGAPSPSPSIAAPPATATAATPAASAAAGVAAAQPASAAGATSTATPAAAPAATPTATAPVPVSDIVPEAESELNQLALLRQRSAQNATRDEDALAFQDLEVEANARIDEVRGLLAAAPSLQILRAVEPGWTELAGQVDALTVNLTHRITDDDRTLADLAQRQTLWHQTTVAAAAGHAPAEVLARSTAVEAALKGSMAAVSARRAALLLLQTRATDLAQRIAALQSDITAANRAATARLLHRDSPGVFAAGFWQSLSAGLSRDGLASLSTQLTLVARYVDVMRVRFEWHVALYILCALAFVWTGRRVRAWSKDDDALRRATRVFETPLAMALVVAILFQRLVYPQEPLFMIQAFGLIAVVPILVVTRPLLKPSLRPLLYALGAFYLVDRIRALASVAPAVSRAILLCELAAAVLALGWTLWATRDRASATRSSRPIHLLRLAGWTTWVGLVLALLADASGYAAFGELAGSGILFGAYLALAFNALLRVVAGLLLALLHLRPLSALALAKRHAQRVVSTLVRWLGVLAFVLWSIVVLKYLTFWEPVRAAIVATFTQSVAIGSLSLSLAQLAGFAAAVWGALLAARVASFILNEEVFPHLSMERGLPYVIATLVRYAILCVGFVLGLAALGIDMTKFTILAGAFSVGLGFGLQNIVNNFVSGLIVLFERPMKVGDVVQLGDVLGQVERIGIRASVIRAFNGAEVIVPNGTLIANNLTNWTFSTRLRRLDIPVQAALASDPDRVRDVLLKVARAQAGVAQTPAPQVLFTQMGPDTLAFELHVWADAGVDWTKLRSDLVFEIEGGLKTAQIAHK